jgi:hypothetical protein
VTRTNYPLFTRTRPKRSNRREADLAPGIHDHERKTAEIDCIDDPGRIAEAGLTIRGRQRSARHLRARPSSRDWVNGHQGRARLG